MLRRGKGKTVWLGGLSGSGKSTLSSRLRTVLEDRGVPVVLLDGDVLRAGLNRDLGFCATDRAENIRRAGETAKLLADEGHTVLAAFITPLESLRKAVRGIFEPGQYVEIFLDCPLEVCEERDPKGLYRRARKGEIEQFTGVSAPFERPAAPDLCVRTGIQTVEESLRSILGFLENRFPDLRVLHVPRTQVLQRQTRVAVLGLDCVPPILVFSDSGRRLHNLRSLMDHGVWGTLKSTDPPITVPAWTTMTTGRDPGELGIYGFRNRLDHSYAEMKIMDSSHVTRPRVWEHLEEAGASSILIGIPQTYPPMVHNGVTVSDFWAPELHSQCTFPESLADEILKLADGEYIADVKDFRSQDRERLLTQLYTMTEKRFRMASDLLIRRSWDFFMMVEMATDRLHHGFWHYWAKEHCLYEPGNPYEGAIPDFYSFLDRCIGTLLGRLSDDTTVMVVSDHGARNVAGGVCINEWLIQNGYLSLRTQPDIDSPFSWDMIDWPRTLAWSEGGYYARIFLNVKGREPEGIIEPHEYESFRDRLAEAIKAIPDEKGRPMSTCVLKPAEIYRTCTNVPPDLVVYFDGLSRRSIGTVGLGRVHVSGIDYGLDGANHDHDGIFVFTRMSDLRGGIRKGTRIADASCLDITPTILHEFGLQVPESLSGRIIAASPNHAGTVPSSVSRSITYARTASRESAASRGFTSKEEEIVKKRLMDLGYI